MTIGTVAHGALPLADRMAYACQAGPGVPIANGHLYRLNIDTGETTDLGLPASNGASLVWDPIQNRLLGFGFETSGDGLVMSLALYDLTSLPGTKIGTTKVAGYADGPARDPTTGRFYLMSKGSTDSFLYEFYPDTGESRFIGYDWGVSAAAIAINSAGEAYTTEVFEYKTLYRVDLNTGRLTAIGPLNEGLPGGHTQALCFDAQDTLWMISGGTIGDEARLFALDTQTGQATDVRFLDDSGWYIGLAIQP